MPTIAEFNDFNFKLAVIQKLMYDEDKLTPKFDVKKHTRKSFDELSEADDDFVPEAVEYFKNLEIPLELLKTIEELMQDGGDRVYAQVYPSWDGEDDVFDILSAADVKWLPNLKRITLFEQQEDDILEEFAKHGVTAEWW